MNQSRGYQNPKKEKEEIMNLTDKLKSDLTQAMKSGNSVKKDILRVVFGELGRSSFPKLGDEDVIKAIRKVVAGNNETIGLMSECAERDRLLAENDILNQYLPKILNLNDTKLALTLTFSEIRLADDLGKAVGMAMKFLKESRLTVDGHIVKQAVIELRNEYGNN
jgi:uncharacterized protein YqeY